MPTKFRADQRRLQESGLLTVSPSTNPSSSLSMGPSSAVATTTTITKSSPASLHRSRTKLLNKLGYFQAPTNSGSNRNSSTVYSKSGRPLPPSSSASSAYASSSVSLLGSVRPTQVRLNDDPTTTTSSSSSMSSFSLFQRQPATDRDDVSNPSSSPSSSSSQVPPPTGTSSSCSVRFHDVVTVLPIPSRHQYSNRIKRVLWSGREELYEMSQRNIFEFQSEGWDWRTVVEDDEMYIDTMTGEKLHPCHYEFQHQQEEQEQQQHQENDDGVHENGDENRTDQQGRQDDEDDNNSSEFEYSDDDNDEDDNGFVFRPLERGQSSSLK